MFRQPFVGDYPITLDYGERFPPLYTDESPHRGIDYGLPMRTMVLSSEKGIVEKTDSLTRGYGKYIVINHNDNIKTIYAHLDEILVRKGQNVEQGEIIGLSGTSGNSTGPHLHFELIRNGFNIDPKILLHCVVDDQDLSPKSETKFQSIHSGKCMVICDAVNVRCHCDMSRVLGTLAYGTYISVGDEVTMYRGLPYRDYYDSHYNCWLRIAEHDPDIQLIKNI